MSTFTAREDEVFSLLTEGDTNSEIGKKLYISEETVKTHVRRVFRRIGARNRAHAVSIAYRKGLVGEHVDQHRIRAAADVLQKHRSVRNEAPADSRFAELYDAVSAALAATPDQPR